ncbi:TonB-dependent siderophore receptor [Chitinophaga sp. sic0106]|uniref:TonB-dependent siderophore receptor n=1 Tax=Chitinophaga sp. sic0106 TaxID=2854785 RepID=UPI001C462AAE|nr:TonB-dependent siderophore receptor [Chitinophaga sp. sic0106]MBV7530916.1 TonB-dependent siderophore receptor [Chitinophaga sp. sic0106]
MLRKTMPIAVFSIFCLTAAAQEKETTDTLKVLSLNELTVTSKYYKKYNLSKISSDLRLQSPLIETPQNIQIISAEVLKDQVVYNLIESVTRNVSGTMREELHNAVSPDIYSRGGYINAQRNGVDLRPLIKGPLGDDAAMIETIEFVKGPAGFMTALSDPAGSYNIVTKKPTGIKKNTFKMMYGSFDLFRAEADLGGLLDEKGKWQYRFNMMGMSTNGFMKFDNGTRLLIAPAVKYVASKKTSFTLEYIYQGMNYMLLSEAQISPYGYGTLPRDFSISDPNTKPYRAKDHNIFFTTEHKFNDNWNLTARISNINNEYNGSIFWVYGKNNHNPDILNRYYVYDGVGYNTFSAQAYIQGRFNTGRIKHAVMGGIDFNDKRNNTTDTWETASTIYPLSISNPQYSQVINNNGIGGSFESENDISGEKNRTKGHLYYISAYVMDEVSVTDKLKLNAGLRMTQSNADFNQYGTKTAASDLVVTPRVGVNYMLLPAMSVYALYDHSYLPQAGVAYDGSPLKPLTGKSYEAGIKKDWHDGTWNTTLSMYQIYRKRTILRDPVSNAIYQTGENRSEGVEVDVRGRVTKGLNIVMNYAFTESKITKDEKNPEMVGMATPNRIKHIQNTWLNYSLPIRKLPGIAISTGYQYMAGRAERFTTTNPEALKDFFRLDAGISYTKKKYSINLIVNNILDDHLYSTAWKRNDMYYWVQTAPRNFRCALTVNI